MGKALFRLGILASISLLSASPALADVKAGVDAWTRGDYDEAVSQWREPAESGDADAMFNLGQAYKLGRGVESDLAKAEELFAKAAAKGHLQAADLYGLMLFQRGEHARAMPFISAAASRGDPRAQYLLGLAHFNGDQVPKDWVRAYALVSLAHQAGLPQAAPALAQMDEYIPLEQRQQSVLVASKLAAEADAARTRQVTAAGLGSAPRLAQTGSPAPMGPPPAATPTPAPRAPGLARGEQAIAEAGRVAGDDSPRSTGADFTRPKASAVTTTPRPVTPPSPAPAAAPARVTQPARTATGDWRVQLGAFGVAGNADALWNRVKNRPELAGHGKVLAPTGKLTRLLAGGFGSARDANAACARLKAGGFQCLVVRK